MLCDLFMQHALPLVFVSVCYSLIGPRHGRSSAYGRFVLVCELQAFAGASLGYFIATISPDSEVATVIAPLFMFPMILLGGLYANVGAIPPAARWINKINPIYYAFQAISLAEWKDYGDIGGFPPVFATGRDVLDFFSLDQRSFDANLWHLVGIGLAIRTAVFVATAAAGTRQGVVDVVAATAATTANPMHAAPTQ